jgi:hypothetical protein
MGILSGSLDEYKQHSWTERFDESWRRLSCFNLIMVLPWVIGAVVLLGQWHVYSRAADRQIMTTGLVTAVGRGNRVNYQFTYANHVYSAMETPVGNQRVPSSGEKITVYYDPQDPAVSGITDLHEKSMGLWGPVPFLIIASSVVTFLILRRIRATRDL